VLGGVKYHCLQCKRQFARSGQTSEFNIFAPPNAAPCTVPPGVHAPFASPSRRHCKLLLMTEKQNTIFYILFFLLSFSRISKTILYIFMIIFRYMYVCWIYVNFLILKLTISISTHDISRTSIYRPITNENMLVLHHSGITAYSVWYVIHCSCYFLIL